MGHETVGLLDPSKVTERDALRFYLTAKPIGGPVEFVSSYHAALRDARATTGRNLDTGAVEHPQHVATWLGAIGYLAFLDQVGTALMRKRPGREAKGNSFERCLRDFAPPSLSARDRQALYALRCSLAHDYSLFNLGRGRSASNLRFRFALHADTGGPLVTHARRRWTGDFVGPQRQSTETRVNLLHLGKLAEACHHNIQHGWSTGRVVARVKPSELLVRYAFFFGEGVQ
jgi:hypothetical protein